MAGCGPYIKNNSSSSYNATIKETAQYTTPITKSKVVAPGGNIGFAIRSARDTSYTIMLSGNGQYKEWSFDPGSYCYINHDGHVIINNK